ncbi:MAG: hypothetical protein KDC87_13940 [Planctomycetes bacterium]|nr:hypothetical protein [Planctomycetota bacterium]MCB9868439.1 hypothetical protein [Planctomycetota bacterium]
MSWTAGQFGVVVVVFAAGGALGALGYRAFGAPSVSPAELTGPPAPSRVEEPVGELATQNKSLRAKVAELEESLRRRQIAEAAVAKAKPTEPSETAAKGFDPLVGDEALKKALAGIDWAKMGGSMLAMRPLLDKIAEALAKGETPPLDALGELQQRNGVLVQMVQALVDAKIPGAGVNGTFSHPAVAANQIGAALQAAGLQLTKAQRETLEQVTRFYSAKDGSLRTVADAREMKLENLLEEVDLKDGFYREAREALTPEQRAALYGEHGAGRTQSDLFGTGVMLGQFAKGVQAKDAPELASAVGKQLRGTLDGLGEAASKQLQGVLDGWASRLPAAYWSDKGDALEGKGMFKTDRVRSALRWQVELTKEILAKVELSPEARRKLLRSQRIFVPLPR